MQKVMILMGSKSDYDIVKDAYDVLKKMEILVEMRVMSAHRTPKEVSDFASTARENGYGVLICAAGKAAHLAGVVAAFTTLPVIGIPVKSSSFDGMDSLLSTVQMPPGIPVATVAVDGAKNAGILAAQILSLANEGIKQKLDKGREEMREKIKKDNENLLKILVSE